VIEQVPALQLWLVTIPLWKAVVGHATFYQRVDGMPIALIPQLPSQVMHEAALDRLDVFRL